MGKLWNLIEATTEFVPVRLDLDEDKCFYARDYIPRTGYEGSHCNQLIHNFKKDASKKNTQEWPHKISAIKQFALELAPPIVELPTGWGVSYVPTSKHKDDPNYDSRYEMLHSELLRLNSNIDFFETCYSIKSIKSSHTGGSRAVHILQANMEVRQLRKGIKGVLLIDDVISSGSHYIACKNLLLGQYPSLEMAGIFWAKTTRPAPEFDF